MVKINFCDIFPCPHEKIRLKTSETFKRKSNAGYDEKERRTFCSQITKLRSKNQITHMNMIIISVAKRTQYISNSPIIGLIEQAICKSHS